MVALKEQAYVSARCEDDRQRKTKCNGCLELTLCNLGSVVHRVEVKDDTCAIGLDESGRVANGEQGPMALFSIDLSMHRHGDVFLGQRRQPI